MTKFKAITKQRRERGMALLLALFALLLLSAIGLCMILASDTETRIDRNYSGSLRGYYDARSGMEEVRDRINFQPIHPTVWLTSCRRMSPAIRVVCFMC